MKREAVIDPSLEKTLLSLHAAMDVGSFWKAIQQLLAAAIPNRLIGLMLQPNPILPMIARWTLPMPDGFFTAEPLENYVAAQQRQRFVRISELFSNRSSLMKSAFYRRYMAPQRCAYGVCLFFWKRQRLICVIVIMRTATQGDLSPTEMNLIRQLYPQFLTALWRLRSLEREHSLRMDLEAFLSRLPLPTILLRWNLKPIYQNRAARDFCAVWEKGTEDAQLTKATSPIPFEILDRCRLLKQQWAHAQPRTLSGPQTGFKEQRVHHPRSPHLRATLHLKQLSSCGVAQPHFLIECEDLHRQAGAHTEPASSNLPHLIRLTRREQEVAQLVCEGRSNQEIADGARLSLPMVKKHLHAIFRKLEVTSRSRLIALMR
jgi:DNA-binding CsgD family transcriptional regulator